MIASAPAVLFTIRIPAAIARTAAGRLAVRALRKIERLRARRAKTANVPPPLAEPKCIPCSGLTGRLTPRQASGFMRMVPGWKAVRNHHLTKTYRFKDFAQGLALVNRIGAVAEQQFHHPDLVLAWGRVEVKIWTHAVDGLTQNDFILAARCDAARAGMKA